jgi:hypothetical protein
VNRARVVAVAGYSGTPLDRKLGIKPGSAVLIEGAPSGFSLRSAGGAPYDVILCFCPSFEVLSSRWAELHRSTTPAGALWIAWPKKSSGVVCDLDENVIREWALTNGRVDVKVCAVDDVWSGLKNVIRKEDR